MLKKRIVSLFLVLIMVIPLLFVDIYAYTDSVYALNGEDEYVLFVDDEWLRIPSISVVMDTAPISYSHSHIGREAEYTIHTGTNITVTASMERIEYRVSVRVNELMTMLDDNGITIPMDAPPISETSLIEFSPDAGLIIVFGDHISTHTFDSAGWFQISITTENISSGGDSIMRMTTFTFNVQDEVEDETIGGEIENDIDPLSPEALDLIEDVESVVNRVQNVIHYLDKDGTGDISEMDMDMLVDFAQNAIARAASMEIDGNLIIVNHSNVETLQDVAHSAVERVEALFESYEIDINRYLNANIFFMTTEFSQVDIRVEPSAMLVDVDQVWIRTPYYGLSLSMEFIENNAHDPLYIHITAYDGGFEARYAQPFAIGSRANFVGIGMLPTNVELNGSELRSYRIEFSRPITEPVRVSVPPAQTGDRTFQTLQRDDGTVVSSRYNQVTGFIDARVQQSGTYSVIENQVDFTDILNQSAEMQHAIHVLASQGILTGVAPLQFAPNNPINRAEFAALVVRMLGIHDLNVTDGFVDVSRNDWFFSVANTARQHGLMTGTGDDTFSPGMNMPNEQLIALGARILRTESRFHDPINPQRYLQAAFVDANQLSSWSINDIALATREGIIMHRVDGRFAPHQTITRGEAALVLYRVYRRIW